MKKYWHFFLLLPLVFIQCKNEYDPFKCEFKPRSLEDRLLIYFIDSVYVSERISYIGGGEEFIDLANEYLETYLFGGDTNLVYLHIEKSDFLDDYFGGKAQLIKTRMTFRFESFIIGGKNTGHVMNFIFVNNKLYEIPNDFTRMLRDYKININDTNYVQLAKAFIEANCSQVSSSISYEFINITEQNFYGKKTKFELVFQTVTPDTIYSCFGECIQLIKREWFFAKNDNRFYEIKARYIEEAHMDERGDTVYTFLPVPRMMRNEYFIVNFKPDHRFLDMY